MEPEKGTLTFTNTSHQMDDISTVNFSTSHFNVTSVPDYEYTFGMDPLLAELIPVSIVYGMTLVLGMLGNILVLFSVTRYQQMMTVTNTFLLSLATADLLLVVICVPVKVSIVDNVVVFNGYNGLF